MAVDIGAIKWTGIACPKINEIVAAVNEVTRTNACGPEGGKAGRTYSLTIKVEEAPPRGGRTSTKGRGRR